MWRWWRQPRKRLFWVGKGEFYLPNNTVGVDRLPDLSENRCLRCHCGLTVLPITNLILGMNSECAIGDFPPFLRFIVENPLCWKRRWEQGNISVLSADLQS